MKADHGSVPQKSSGREPAFGEIRAEERDPFPWGWGGVGVSAEERRGAGHLNSMSPSRSFQTPV